jgi:hypothetical protein
MFPQKNPTRIRLHQIRGLGIIDLTTPLNGLSFQRFFQEFSSECFPMRSCSLAYFSRVALMLFVAAFLAFGPAGCDSSSGPKTGSSSQLPPEAKQANENMENFMKTQKK